MNPLRTLVTLASLGAWCVATLPCQGVVTLLPVQDTTLYQDPNGGVATDPNDGFVPIDDLAPVVPGCGFGIGFASMMCMVSLCGVRRYGR